jgi:hypothetical protein
MPPFGVVSPFGGSVWPGQPGYPEASRFRDTPMNAYRGSCHDSRSVMLRFNVMSSVWNITAAAATEFPRH